MENEIWKDVLGYEGLYQVSSYGNVFSFKNDKLLSLSKNKAGYINVSLYLSGARKTFRVHKIVMETFAKSTTETDIDHIDGDKTNNRLDNLEYVTHRENVIRGAVSRKNKNKSSQYSNVSFNKRKQKWRAYVKTKEGQNHIGYFDNESLAYNAVLEFKRLRNVV